MGCFDLSELTRILASFFGGHSLRESASDNVSFTPLWDERRHQFIISHGYCPTGTQAIGVKCEEGSWTTSLNWSNRKLRIVHTNAVVIGDTLFGTNHDPATIAIGINCLNGRLRFRQRLFGKANLAKLGDYVLAMAEDGELHFGKLNLDGFRSIWSRKISDQKSWTLPSYSGNLLITRNGKELHVLKFSQTEDVPTTKLH